MLTLLERAIVVLSAFLLVLIGGGWLLMAATGNYGDSTTSVSLMYLLSWGIPISVTGLGLLIVVSRNR